MKQDETKHFHSSM